MKSEQDIRKNMPREDQDKQWHNSLGNQVENRKADDCWKIPNDADIDDNNIETEKKTYSDDSLEDQIIYNMWQNSWTNFSDRTSLELVCGTGKNKNIN